MRYTRNTVTAGGLLQRETIPSSCRRPVVHQFESSPRRARSPQEAFFGQCARREKVRAARRPRTFIASPFAHSRRRRTWHEARGAKHETAEKLPRRAQAFLVACRPTSDSSSTNPVWRLLVTHTTLNGPDALPRTCRVTPSPP